MIIYEYKGKFYTDEQLQELVMLDGDIVTQYNCNEVAKFMLKTDNSKDNVICFESHRIKNMENSNG